MTLMYEAFDQNKEKNIYYHCKFKKLKMQKIQITKI